MDKIINGYWGGYFDSPITLEKTPEYFNLRRERNKEIYEKYFTVISYKDFIDILTLQDFYDLIENKFKQKGLDL